MADIIRQYGNETIAKYRPSILPSHYKTMQNIVDCRTSALGGQTWKCEECRKIHYSYHSCRNRHCPKCQNDRANQWLAKQYQTLLPTSYFLATITIPNELHTAFQQHQRMLYSLLFRAAAQALLILAKEKKYLGADIGMMGVLHTWTRDLRYHPHIHFLIPAGGLTKDGKRWKWAKPDFLVHVKPLSILIRRLFKDALIQKNLNLHLPVNTWKKKWVCHIKPVGNGQSALKYLAPYIMRVAISDKNIINLQHGKVTFRYKDAQTDTVKTRSLDANEFIYLFLQHILPKSFVKVRYFGILATKKRGELAYVKELIGERLQTNIDDLITDDKIMKCPDCGHALIFVAEIPKTRGPPNIGLTISKL
ncbi:MAG: IS91 family transposase [candidate division KSB1 bacterium]|nr:IS91 family transposase [candidate division KSB1 bacterium]